MKLPKAKNLITLVPGTTIREGHAMKISKKDALIWFDFFFTID